MATHSVSTSKHATLSGTTVDTVTLTEAASKVEVLNHGTNRLYITYGVDPADPTSGGDDTLVIPAGMAIELDANSRANFKVKLLGDGDAYSVQRVDQ